MVNNDLRNLYDNQISFHNTFAGRENEYVITSEKLKFYFRIATSKWSVIKVFNMTIFSFYHEYSYNRYTIHFSKRTTI